MRSISEFKIDASNTADPEQGTGCCNFGARRSIDGRGSDAVSSVLTTDCDAPA
jgi:hypothetical protein